MLVVSLLASVGKLAKVISHMLHIDGQKREMRTMDNQRTHSAGDEVESSLARAARTDCFIPFPLCMQGVWCGRYPSRAKDLLRRLMSGNSEFWGL